MAVTSQSPPRDPRSLVTPDAFDVSEELLGMPLAAPWRRFVALLIDLAAIGTLTLLTRSFALVLGVVAAAFFIRMSFKRTDVRGSVFGRAMRFSLGCLGVFIGLVTAAIWASLGLFRTVPEVPGVVDVAVETPVGEVPGLGTLLAGLADVREFREAESAEEAEAVATDLARVLLSTEMDPEGVEELLLEAAPDETEWRGEAPDIVRRALAAARGTPVPSEDVEAPSTALATEVSALSASEALREYAALLQSGSGEDDPRATLLRARIQEAVAGDTLATLAEELDRLERRAQRGDETARELREALRTEREGGGFASLRNFVDELGFGFGWASLYMTVLLSWWKGQTPGKKLLGIRVVRLDGQPITWWVAFERAGGYAAGFATGLLGFAQVWWDANRQAIHDRIVGTVVVIDGAEPIGNWTQVM